MSPSEELKAAAECIREIAGEATPGLWLGDPTGTVCAVTDLVADDDGSQILPFRGPSEVAECYRSERPNEKGANAQHIALWDPPTAVLVAAVLDQWAWMVGKDWDLIHRVGGPEVLALARHILRGAQ